MLVREVKDKVDIDERQMRRLLETRALANEVEIVQKEFIFNETLSDGLR